MGETTIWDAKIHSSPFKVRNAEQSLTTQLKLKKKQCAKKFWTYRVAFLFWDGPVGHSNKESEADKSCCSLHIEKCDDEIKMKKLVCLSEMWSHKQLSIWIFYYSNKLWYFMGDCGLTFSSKRHFDKENLAQVALLL